MSSTSTSALPTHPNGRADVVFRPLAEEWVLFDPVAERIHVLNFTGAVVWAHCTGESTLAEIAESLAGYFEQAPPHERLLRDVEEAVRGFQREGLLE